VIRTPAVICIIALVALPACVTQDAHRRALAANEQLQEERDALAAHVRELAEQNEKLAHDVQRLGASAADAAWIADQKAKIRDMLARLQSGGSLDLEGVTVRQSAEGIVVQVQGEVLFPPGQAELTSKGKSTLEKIAAEVVRAAGPIRVEGHTDSDPITRSSWKTNLRLSSERAHSVAMFLISAGVPADTVAIAGYGEYRPIEPGNSDAAKQANRRVEILLLRQ